MTLDTIKHDIENCSIPSVYLWYGEDRYSLTEALKLLKNYYLLDDPSGSNTELFNKKEQTLEEIIQAANMTAFFSGKLVVVDDLPYFSMGRSKGVSEPDSSEETELSGSERGSDTDILLEYCLNPNPSTCLVLISEKVNRGRKLFKEINKNGKTVEFAFPKSQSEWTGWLQVKARQNGKNLSVPVASFLLEWAGHQTGVLSQELAKLALFTGEKQNIEIEDIQKICLPMIETTIFVMLDTIAAENTKDALTRLGEVLSQEHYLKVHTMIVRHIRLLLAARICRARRGTVNDFMDMAGIRTFFEGNKLFQQAASFSANRLAEAMEDCLQTELALKSSGGNPQLLLEMMVIRLCRR